MAVAQASDSHAPSHRTAAAVSVTQVTNAAAKTMEIHAARVHSAAAETAMVPATVFRVAVRLMDNHVLIMANAALAIVWAELAQQHLHPPSRSINAAILTSRIVFTH